MAVLNLTPDSFSDGGQHRSLSRAIDHAQAMIDAGADLIDIGGESTRPGASPVSATEELDRVLPVISALRQHSDIPISIDTSKPEVMRAAADAGVDMINDVAALRATGALEAAAATGLPVCLMHMQGRPDNMQQAPAYADVIGEITTFLSERIEACMAAGIDRQQLILDPGFGFGKTLSHNLAILSRLEQFAALELPLLIGVSRKSMFGQLLDLPVSERGNASVCAAMMAMERGASILRVHDVMEHVQARDLYLAVRTAD